jgi:hypothetical protein
MVTNFFTRVYNSLERIRYKPSVVYYPLIFPKIRLFIIKFKVLIFGRKKLTLKEAAILARPNRNLEMFSVEVGSDIVTSFRFDYTSPRTLFYGVKPFLTKKFSLVNTVKPVLGDFISHLDFEPTDIDYSDLYPTNFLYIYLYQLGNDAAGFRLNRWGMDSKFTRLIISNSISAIVNFSKQALKIYDNDNYLINKTVLLSDKLPIFAQSPFNEFLYYYSCAIGESFFGNFIQHKFNTKEKIYYIRENGTANNEFFNLLDNHAVLKSPISYLYKNSPFVNFKLNFHNISSCRDFFGNSFVPIKYSKQDLLDILNSYMRTGLFSVAPSLEFLNLQESQLMLLLLYIHQFISRQELEAFGIYGDPTLTAFLPRFGSKEWSMADTMFYFMSQAYVDDVRDFKAANPELIAALPKWKYEVEPVIDHFFPFGPVNVEISRDKQSYSYSSMTFKERNWYICRDKSKIFGQLWYPVFGKFKEFVQQRHNQDVLGPFYDWVDKELPPNIPLFSYWLVSYTIFKQFNDNYPIFAKNLVGLNNDAAIYVVNCQVKELGLDPDNIVSYDGVIFGSNQYYAHYINYKDLLPVNLVGYPDGLPALSNFYRISPRVGLDFYREFDPYGGFDPSFEYAYYPFASTREHKPFIFTGLYSQRNVFNCYENFKKICLMNADSPESLLPYEGDWAYTVLTKGFLIGEKDGATTNETRLPSLEILKDVEKTMQGDDFSDLQKLTMSEKVFIFLKGGKNKSV